MDWIVNLFSLSLWILTFGLIKKYPKKGNSTPFFSIIIACRNEENYLPQLFESLEKLIYPKDKFEIIITDDASTDNSLNLLKSFSQKNDHVKIIEIKKKSADFKGKKAALSKAIKQSVGEILLYTDADCVVPTNWLESYASQFSNKYDMIIGSTYEKDVTRFDYFARIITNAIFAATIGLKIPFSCSGGNFAIRKKVFDEIGGYTSIKHHTSGEDKLLLNLVSKSGFKIGFNFSSKVWCNTQPVERYNQKKRRMGKFAKSSLLFKILSILLLIFMVIMPIRIIYKKAYISLLITIISAFTFISIFKIRNNEKIKFSDLYHSILYPYYLIYYSVLGSITGWKWKE